MAFPLSRLPVSSALIPAWPEAPLLRHPVGVLLAVLILFASVSRTLGKIYEVSGGGGGSIQAAIATAVAGDTLLLRGSFSGPGNVELDPAGKDLVYLSDAALPAVLNGGGQTILRLQSGESAATLLAGLRFSDSPQAIRCANGSAPLLRDCRFSDNYGSAASGPGGAGLRVESGAAPRLERCTFESNAHLIGGAVCVAGGTPLFIDCEFALNTAAWGGAVAVEGGAPEFLRASFTNNTAYPLPGSGGQLEGGDGGGAFVLAGTPSFNDCLWDANGAVALGGSAVAGGHGGALRVTAAGAASLAGCTLHANTAERSGGGLSLDGTATSAVEASLIALNLPDGLHGDGSASLAITCSDVWGDGAPGYGGTLADATGTGGNLAVDPIFCGGVGGQTPLGLHASSPCLPAHNACGVQMGRFGQACSGNLHVHEVPLEFATIQAAIDAAVAGDTIHVAPGTYTGVGNHGLNPGGKDLVIESSGGAGVTIIDCQGADRGFVYATGETAASKLRGFTIRGGRHTTGGGLLLINSTPTLVELVLAGNVATTDGGALACIGASPSASQLVIEDNECAGSGAALLCTSGASPVLSECQLYDNQAGSRGGALFCPGGAPSFQRCTIAFNSAPEGGGLWVEQGGLVTLERSLVVFNLAGGGIVADAGAFILATCGDVFGNAGGDWGGTTYDPAGVDGNISADPLFCNPLGRDFHLDADSPCAAAHNDCGLDLGPLGVGCDLIYRAIGGHIARSSGVPVATVAIYGSYYEAHTNEQGNYSVLVPDHWTGFLLPSKLGYSFEPVFRSYNNVGADIGGQDYLALRSTLHRVPSEFHDIQSALDFAENGDTVLVAPGIYSGNANKRLDFGGRSIRLFGEQGAGSTIIDCEQAGRGFDFNDGEGAGAVVDGFTVRNGHVFYEWESYNGGGIRVSGASPTLRNLVIENCRARGAGGAIVLGNSQSQLSNLTLRDNEAYGDVYGNGGGLAVFGGAPAASGLLVHDNLAAEDGGAVYFSGGTSQLSQSTLSDNSAGRGGALALAYTAQLTLQRLVVSFNSAASGGALFEADAPSTTTWACSDIFGNGAAPYGGYAQAPGADCLAEDPLYCVITGLDYELADASPCVPENNDCGVLMGARGIGCTLTPTTPVPGSFYLAPNHPNPFNPATELRFGLPDAATVTLQILDVQGREVARPLAAALLPAGEHRLRWEAKDDAGRPLPSGVYFCRLEAAGQQASRTLLLLK